ncbi:MAG: hypothetical protein ACR65R_07660 [Methylomicrobium sp.]
MRQEGPSNSFVPAAFAGADKLRISAAGGIKVILNGYSYVTPTN